MRDKLKQYFEISIQPVKVLGTYICLFAAACILLILANMLPSERIRSNIWVSTSDFIREGNYPYMGIEETSYALDNWTEAVLLSFYYTADCTRPVYSAFIASAYQPDNSTGVERLELLVEDANWEQSPHILNRSSYWLGYGIFLRPLLLFFDYSTCRMLLNVASYALLVIVIVIMTKRLGGHDAIGFGITLTAFNYYLLSLQYTLGIFSVFVMYAAILYILYNKAKINYFYFMFIVGIFAAYFEWFSIPLITFGLPVLVSLQQIRKKDINCPFAQYFNTVFQSGIGWSVGYGIMVISKVFAAMSVVGMEAWSYFRERLTDDSSTMQIRDFIKSVLQLIRCVFPFNMIDNDWVLTIVIGLILLFWIIMILGYKKNRDYNMIILIVAFAPLAWYFVFKGHIGHVGIEYRTLMISYYAGWIFLVTCFDSVKDWFQKGIKSET